jgi:3-keto-disaccharide hydrolase
MKRSLPFLPALLVFALAANSFAADDKDAEIPPPKDEPRVINPGPPPSDAIVLFDGKDLSQWVDDRDGSEPKWEVKDGEAKAIVSKIRTKQSFGDCQLHIEWATPSEVKGSGQGRGNNGVLFQGRYEIQILDSYQNPTYFHGQAGAIYKQHAPLVNASRKPGEWQSYDIIFHPPHFDAAGKLEKPGTFTVLHNGVLIQDHAEILGTTSHIGHPKYEAHPLKQPLVLYYHSNPVRFRNIWIREL